MEATIWLFAIYCTAQCPWFSQKKVENEYFNSSTAEGCVEQANKLINMKGLIGTWEIECKPYQRKVIVRPIQGN